MLSKAVKILKPAIYPILLCLIILIVCVKNYTPGTFLTGWDTLHPEFNPSLYWKRILGGVWQEHQGLGAVGSQSHSSEIPRMLILAVIDLFFKVDFIRYAYAFLMLFLGPFGVFFFLKDVLLKKFNPSARGLGSFIGALFYVLNLGTLQHFYVPLEMFLTHFGFLGWYMWSSSMFYSTGKRKFLIFFSLFTFFGASQAHTSTLFYAYVIYFVTFLVVVLLADLSEKRVWQPFYVKRSALLLLFMFLINSFWLFPNLYFAVNHGSEVNMSKIHSLFSNEAFQANKEYGEPRDVTILRSFLFGWGEHVGNSQYGELLDEWVLHLNSPGVLISAYGFFVLACLGVLVSIFKREKFAFGVFAFFGIGIFFLFNVNPPFGKLFVLLQDNIPLFREAFRFPFTKFSIGLMFAYSSFLAYMISWLSSVFYRFTHRILLPYFVQGLIGISTTLLLIYVMYPAFTGHLISPSMRVKIPERYFEMFRFFDEQNEYGRVADFPVHSFWGWVYYNWNPENQLGYQGAGFLWFGLKQPLLNREFDRWNLLNEQYYREMSYAVYSKNTDLFTQVLDKYKVKWLLVDESVIVPGGDSKQLFYSSIIELFNKTGKIELSRDFGDGLKVYKYDSESSLNLAELHDAYYEVKDTVYKEPTDPIFSVYNPYIRKNEEHFPYVGITATEETLRSEFVQNTDSSVFINPKFVSTEPVLSADTPSLETGKTVPFLLTVERDPGTGGFSISFRQASSGREVTSIGKEAPGLSSLSIGYENSPFLFSVDNDIRGIYFGSGEYGKKEINFNYDVPNGNSFKIFRLNEGMNVDSAFAGQLEPCSDLYELSSYEVSRTLKGFKLSADNLKGCFTVPFSSLLSDKEKTSIRYVISADVTPSSPNAICIFSDLTGLCENFYKDGVHLFRPQSSLSTYYLRFLSNALGREGVFSTTFENIKVLSVDESLELPVQLNEQDVLNTFVSEPYAVSRGVSYGGDAAGMDHYFRYCNLLKNQEGLPNISASPGVLNYNSQQTAICDSFPFPYLPQNTGYLLEIRAKNVLGTPLRVCLTNEYSKKCDLYVELPKNQDMKSYFYLIPPMGEEMGYTVNFSNLVFGADSTINQLEKVYMSPVAYDYLRGLHSSAPRVTDKGLVVLNESYEGGWLALCGVLPCKAEHVMVNNWSNGWVFSEPPDLSKIKLVFWPELLEYAGALLLIPVVLFLFKYKEDYEG